MRATTASSVVLAVGLFLYTASAVPVSPRADVIGVSSTLYDNFVRYTKYSSAAYQLICPSPLGNTLVRSFSEDNTQGFIARDDSRKEIVVSFRGTFSIADAITDIELALTPLVSPGTTLATSASVHWGFLRAYNVVADEVISAVKSEVAKHPSYTLIVTGHSLGGALASLGAVSLKAALPNTSLKLYTFGQPRTGDAQWASYVDSKLGLDNIYRAVHTFDGVPTLVPELLGYRHHGREYWQFEDPILTSGPNTVQVCTNGDEDPSCSHKIPSTGINPPHLFYFGQVMAVNPLLCI